MIFQYEKDFCEHLWKNNNIFKYTNAPLGKKATASKEFTLKHSRFDFFIINKDDDSGEYTAVIIEAKLRADHNSIIQILNYRDLLRGCTNKFKQIHLSIVCLDHSNDLPLLTANIGIDLIVCSVEIEPEFIEIEPAFCLEEQIEILNKLEDFEKRHLPEAKNV